MWLNMSRLRIENGIRRAFHVRRGIYYNGICLYDWNDNMKRLLGFAFFLIAVGMFIMLILPNDFIGIVLIFVFMLLGYNLFCC